MITRAPGSGVQDWPALSAVSAAVWPGPGVWPGSTARGRHTARLPRDAANTCSIPPAGEPAPKKTQTRISTALKQVFCVGTRRPDTPRRRRLQQAPVAQASKFHFN